MRRRHLFEFNDQPWLPETLRQGLTSFLVTMHQVVRLDRLWAPMIARVLQTTGETRWVDLCSGAGGPLRLLRETLREKHGLSPTVVRTDLYPSGDAIRVNAMDVPKELKGLRTIFAGFHHFRPEEARAILTDAYEDRQPIAIFEATLNHPRGWLSVIFVPLFVLIFTPKMRPVRLSQYFFTYVIPLLPLMAGWDGLVSHLRTYSAQELRELVNPLDSSDYRWEIGEFTEPARFRALPYLLGYPLTQKP